MCIDNFDLIKSLINFSEDSGSFFHLQVIRRGKDHPNLPSANRVIKTYYVTSVKYLDKIKDEVIKLCQLFKARAYINIGVKSFEDLAKLTNFRLSERIYSGDFKKIYKVVNTCSGELKTKNTRWIVDIDDVNTKNQVLNWLDSYFNTSERAYLRAEIPTLNGVHLIVLSKFDTELFKEQFPNIDVHKNNNPTLLYAENGWKDM